MGDRGIDVVDVSGHGNDHIVSSTAGKDKVGIARAVKDRHHFHRHPHASSSLLWCNGCRCHMVLEGMITPVNGQHHVIAEVCTSYRKA